MYRARTLFSIFKKRQGGFSLLPPNCAPVSVAEYASTSLNIPQYTGKHLNKLFWLFHDSEYAWSSYMFNRFLKMPQILNVLWFWIWHGCTCKSYKEFWRCRDFEGRRMRITQIYGYVLLYLLLKTAVFDVWF